MLSLQIYLVIGKRDRLPMTGPFFEILYENEGIYKKA